MKTVLVTGGTGFIGRHVVPELLARGFEVHVAARGTGPVAMPSGVRTHRCDLFDVEQQRTLFEQVKPSHLLHLAWYAVHGKFWTSDENIRWVQCSLDLLRHFTDQGGSRVVMAGTCAEYDWSHGLCSEFTTPIAPATLYGRCKNDLRQSASRHCSQVKLSHAWGRIFLLFGPHEDPGRLVPSVITSLLNHQPARCTHGRQVRDFMHVADVASAFAALLDSDAEGPVNIASGQSATIKEVVELIAEKLDCRELVELGKVPAPENDPPSLLAEVQRLNNEVGWKPVYRLETGLDQAIQWWKTELGKP